MGKWYIWLEFHELETSAVNGEDVLWLWWALLWI